jgi:hypothetical protein
MKFRLFLCVLVDQVAMGINDVLMLLNGRVLLLAILRNILSILFG